MLLSRLDRVLSGSTGKGERLRSALAPEIAAQATGQDSAGVIGERFETMQDSLEQLTDMARQFARFEGILGQIREPLVEEFRSRRDAHVEAINLRAANAELVERVEHLSTEGRRRAEALAEAETRSEELAARGADQAAGIQETRLELDRVRNLLSQATTRIENFETAERVGAQRILELEQDLSGLRSQLKQAETLRAEADTARAQAQRDHTLAIEENTVLRRRMDEVAAEVASLARVAAAGEGQLAAERARSASEQAEAARALRALENQVETDRSELAALTARLDAATARANGLDVLNAEQAGRLADLQAVAQAAERHGDTLQVTLDRALERTRVVEGAFEEGRQRLAAMDVARLAAVDRAEALTKAAAVHDKAIARAEERMLKIQGRLAAAQDEHQARVEAMTQQITALRAELESVRADAAMSAAALESARRDRGYRPVPQETQASVQSIVG
jgi:crescentin